MTELFDAARAFYNATIADDTVLIRTFSAEKQAAVIAAGKRLRAILQAATPTGTTMTIDIINSAADATMSPDEREAFDKFSDDTKQRLLNQILKRDATRDAPAEQFDKWAAVSEEEGEQGSFKRLDAIDGLQRTPLATRQVLMR